MTLGSQRLGTADGRDRVPVHHWREGFQEGDAAERGADLDKELACVGVDLFDGLAYGGVERLRGCPWR